MIKILFHIFLLFVLFTLSTCKKYPEDDFISLRRVEKRLCGEWKLEKIEINDENVGYRYNDSLAPFSFTDFWFWFKFNAKLDNTPKTYDLFLINKSSKGSTDAQVNNDVSGTAFSIYPKKEKRLLIANRSNEIPIKDQKSSNILLNLFGESTFSKSSILWDIKKLYAKQLILEKSKNGNRLRLSLKRIRND